MKTIQIAGRQIGPGAKPFLIAEVAQAHDGSLGMAHSYIDAAASAGADAVKFQTHIASSESTKDEPFRTHFSLQDKSRYEYWKRMEFTEEQWQGLAEQALKKGIIFLSSPFSVEAARLLDRVGVPAWKIGSGELNNPLLFDEIAGTAKPVLLSTGMSPWEEIRAAVIKVENSGNELALLQCASEYPASLSHVGLNVIDEYRKRFQVPVGLSDHSGSIFPSLAAMARGADIIEVHLVFNRSMFGPDVSSSITVDELALLAQARDAFHEMDSNPVDKDAMAGELEGTRSLFNKSVALTQPQGKGSVLTIDMLTTKKPGTGIPAGKLDQVVGARLKRDVPADRVLSWDDLDI